ncbi:hypothetical protein [Mameliella alba]|uniref:Uncharacterized protein n=1 Tax=Mameliella alba TaxID=561184 RepID=A0A0B3S0Y5_9RHOB|nr:hypothetical protein [Mameliella alba]KHQ50276.1 hypothetical protein OA50_05124 [Mameliella alba]
MSGLTVPKAPNSAGRVARAPNLSSLASSALGEGIEDLGKTMLDVGTTLENDRLDREMQRHEVDLARDVNDLRLEIEQIGDPDAADAAWQNGVKGLRARYEAPDEDGRPRVDPKNSERFGLAFDSLTDSVSYSLGRRSLGLRQSQREANWISYAHEATVAASTADPRQRDELIAMGDRQIAAMLAAGAIDPAEAEKRRLGLRADVSNARAIQAISDDPDAFIAELDGGGFTGLEADTRARYRTQAERAIEARAKEEARELERAAEAREKEVGDRLKSMTEIMLAGREAVDEKFLATPEAQAHPLFAETMAARQLREDGVDLKSMTPSQIDALIAGERTKKLKEPYQLKKLELLEDALAAHEKGYETDPIGYRQDLGLQVTDLPELDPADTSRFSRALEFRFLNAEQLVKEGFTRDIRMLSNAERDELNARAGVDADPAERLALAKAIIGSDPGAADHVIGQVEDPVFAHVAGLLEDGGSDRVAQDILRGQRIIAEKTVIMPPEAERKDEAYLVLRGYFAGVPASEDIEASVLAAADALYASRVRQQAPDQDVDGAEYRRAVHEVLGGTIDGRDKRGGLQDIRGAMTLLPAGVKARQVEDALGELSTNLSGARTPADPQGYSDMIASGRPRAETFLTPDEARERGKARLQRISLSGGLPTFDGFMIHPEDLRQAQVRAVGPGRYRLWLDGEYALDHTTGAPYEFNMFQLLREVGQ